MGTAFSLLLIAVAVFAGYATKKYHDKPYIVNYSLALLLLLIIIRTVSLKPITSLGWFAIVICFVALLFQLVLGMKNRKQINETNTER